MFDERDSVITCVCCRGLRLTSMFSGRVGKYLLTEGEVRRKVFSNKIIVTLVTQGLLSSFLSRPVA